MCQTNDKFKVIVNLGSGGFQVILKKNQFCYDTEDVAKLVAELYFQSG